MTNHEWKKQMSEQSKENEMKYRQYYALLFSHEIKSLNKIFE